MDIFGILELIGGLALFLFGMSLMGNRPGKKCRQQTQRISGKANIQKT